MELITFVEFCENALKLQQEEDLRAEYNALLPYMYLKMLKFKSFDDYCDARTGRNIDWRPADVIIAEIEEAHRNAKGGN